MGHFVRRASFLFGILIGIFLAVIFRLNEIIKSAEPEPFRTVFDITNYQKWFEGKNLTRRYVSLDYLRYGNKSYYLESKYLHDKIPVLCLVFVKTPKNADAVKATWGASCNELQFLNLTREKKKMPVLGKSESSWVSLCEVLKSVPEQFNWVLVVYDYTFVLVENLRLFLAGFKPEDRYYLGHAVQFWSTVYNMGQAGYVLSKGTVDTFKDKFSDKDSCNKMRTYRNQEDLYLGKSLAGLEIFPIDTRDKNGLSTFHPYNLYHVFSPKDNTLSVFPHKCCSPHTITFQVGLYQKIIITFVILFFFSQLRVIRCILIIICCIPFNCLVLGNLEIGPLVK